MSGTQLVIEPAAIADLVAIDGWLRDRSDVAAQRFSLAVQAALVLIATKPGVGHPQRFRNPKLRGVRSLAVPKFRTYLLFYQPDEATVRLLRVLHSARDVRRIINRDR